MRSALARSSQDLSAKRNLVLTVIAGWLLITGCARGPQRNQLLSTNADWREFQGTWSAAGSRTTMQLERTHEASISRLTGSLLLSGPSRPAVGFRAEAIVFNDSLSGMVGRAVWTDERGDQAFSELRGQGTKTANRIFGTFTGGTGRYAGISGGYEFSWRFLLESEDGDVQGQSFGLTGRVRVDATGAAGSEGHGQ